jgi:hypothetical protein
MIRLAWIGMVVACSSTPPQHQQPGTTVVAPTRPDVHRYREAVVNAALAALSDGDVEALAALVAPGCEAEARKSFAATAAKAKGLKVETQTLTFAASPKRYNEAKLEGACAPKGEAMVHDVALGLRVDHDGRTRREHTDMFLVETGGRFYLATLPDYVGGGGAKPNDMVSVVRGFTERMCACRDKACADQVQEDLTKWGTEMAKKADRDERPDDETMKQITDLIQHYTECMTKLMVAP